MDTLVHYCNFLTKSKLSFDEEFIYYIAELSSEQKAKDEELFNTCKADFDKFKSNYLKNLKHIEKKKSINEKTSSDDQKIRLYVDGAFDITHSGHFNALRRAKQLCDVLVVGVCSDEEIKKYKGPPLMTVVERADIIKGCKWVDEVI